MLNVLDEKWKDHLYDLDQLRNAIHYRSWGQKDPLIEYKQEAYTMFVDLMNDIYHTFTERFLRAQIQFDPPPVSRDAVRSRWRWSRTDAVATTRSEFSRTLFPEEEVNGEGEPEDVVDIGPASRRRKPAARAEPIVTGCRACSLVECGRECDSC